MKTFILLLACGLGGYTIGDIGQKLGIPFWMCVVLALIFGWTLGGIA